MNHTPTLSRKNRFSLGDIFITSNAQDRLTSAQVTNGLARHSNCDFGDISPDDRNANLLALECGGRVLSVYGRDDRRFWIITEADRSSTTVLLPEDY